MRVERQQEEHRQRRVVAQLVPVLGQAQRGIAQRVAVQRAPEDVVVLAEIEVVGLEASVHAQREHGHVDGVADDGREHEQGREPAAEASGTRIAQRSREPSANVDALGRRSAAAARAMRNSRSPSSTNAPMTTQRLSAVGQAAGSHSGGMNPSRMAGASRCAMRFSRRALFHKASRPATTATAAPIAIPMIRRWRLASVSVFAETNGVNQVPTAPARRAQSTPRSRRAASGRAG